MEYHGKPNYTDFSNHTTAPNVTMDHGKDMSKDHGKDWSKDPSKDMTHGGQENRIDMDMGDMGDIRVTQ